MIIKIYNCILFLHKIKIPIIPQLLNFLIIRIIFSCKIGLGATFGKGTDLGYWGLGTVIHPRSIIGKNTGIGTGVTIGATNKILEVPIIGDNCKISTGSKIIGPIKIGNNVIVGANAVVVKDIPDNCVVVGVPAKIIKTNIEISKYNHEKNVWW